MLFFIIAFGFLVLALPSSGPRGTGSFLEKKRDRVPSGARMGTINWNCELLGYFAENEEFRTLLGMQGNETAYVDATQKWIAKGGPVTLLDSWEPLNQFGYLVDPTFDWWSFLAPAKIPLHFSRRSDEPAIGCPTCITSDLALPAELTGYRSIELKVRQALDAA